MLLYIGAAYAPRHRTQSGGRAHGWARELTPRQIG